jgi:phage/plasmid-like protein (TIGR03299 family)
MAHQIDESNNRNNMAYVGSVPWHGLGQSLDANADIETWKVEAGMNWHIQKRPLTYGVKNENGEIVPAQVPDQFAHIRSDNQEFLGQGSKRFQLLQPGDALEFFRDIVDGSDFALETAGCLRGGAQFWALARCNKSLVIDGVDRLNAYLLLATANDGSMSTVADFTTVRVVCNNTLTMAVGSNGQRAKIKVPHSRKFDQIDVKSQLGLVDNRIESFALEADMLAHRPLSKKEAIDFFLGLYANFDADGKVTNERTVNSVMPKLLNAYSRGPGSNLATASGTAWGAVNAVTNYVDFNTRAQSADNRFASGQIGAGMQLKQQAFANALELAAA